MTTKGRVRSVLHRFGYDIHRFQTDLLTCTWNLLSAHDISLVLDVGANEGQFARQLRTLGYAGDLWSFEPGAQAYAALAAAASSDPRWSTYPVALGAKAGTATLNLAGNSVSSSLLPMAPLHSAEAPKSTYVATEQITVTTLDELSPPTQPTWLKIDTQGYELPVLEGGTTTLAQVAVLQLEVSLAPLYEGQSDYRELLSFVLGAGFEPVFVEPAMQDSLGRMLQVEALFTRKQA